MGEMREYHCGRCGKSWDVLEDAQHCPECGGLMEPGEGPRVTPAIEEIALRPEVLRLAQEMERQLRAHEDRPGWKDEPLMYLYARMLEETHELSDVVMQGQDPGVTWHEAADVANMAMMVADAYEHQYGHLVGWRRKDEAASPSEHAPAQVRPDFVMPALDCLNCGHPLVPLATDTGDGWFLGWDYCDHCQGDAGIEDQIAWPFAGDWASAEDLRRLGFRID